MAMEDFNEYLLDQKYNIHTCGRSEIKADKHHFPYEATSFSVLRRIAEEGYVKKDNVLLDYGCGRGRVPIFFSKETGCKTIGVEFADGFFQEAVQNVADADVANLVQIEKIAAEKYLVPEDVDVVYFFNPFSVEIFKKVVSQLLDSYYRKVRPMRILLYYPQVEYIAYLMSVEEVTFEDEIDCSDLFNEDTDRNRVMVFGMY